MRVIFRRNGEVCIDGSHRVMHTPPKAVASKDMKGFTASKWKNTKFSPTVKIDIQLVKLLRQYLKTTKKAIQSPGWNCDIFYCEEMIKDIDYCLDVIGKVIKESKTTLAGDGYMIHHYIKSDAGRLYARRLNLQTTPRAIKQAALHGLWEYDFENCHYAIVQQLAANVGMNTPAIDNYLTRKKAIRQLVASEVGIKEWQAKKLLIAVIYRLRPSVHKFSKAVELVGVTKARGLYKHPVFEALMDEVSDIRKVILLNWDDQGRGTYRNAMGKRIRKSDNTPSEILAHLIQGIEAKMLRVAIKLYEQDIVLLQHECNPSSAP